jgi:hypothetical protein
VTPCPPTPPPGFRTARATLPLSSPTAAPPPAPPQPGAEVEHAAVVRREAGRVYASRNARGHAAELVLEAAELLRELGAGVGLGHGLGEAVVEDVEVVREDAALRAAAEEALQEAELVRLGPDALELEGRLLLVGSAASAGRGHAERVRGGRGGRGRGRGRRPQGAALDGELARGGRRGRGQVGWCGRVRVGQDGDRDREGLLVRGHGAGWRARHGSSERAPSLCGLRWPPTSHGAGAHRRACRSTGPARPTN